VIDQISKIDSQSYDQRLLLEIYQTLWWVSTALTRMSANKHLHSWISTTQ
jgi:hypothetical protein